MTGGYDKLAAFMSNTEHTIVRKYRHLAIRDLLYLQAELCHLDLEYNLIAQEDAEEEDERKIYDKEWWYLQKSKERGFDGKQWEHQLKIREKLREYCKLSRLCIGVKMICIFNPLAEVPKFYSQNIVH